MTFGRVLRHCNSYIEKKLIMSRELDEKKKRFAGYERNNEFHKRLVISLEKNTSRYAEADALSEEAVEEAWQQINKNKS